MKMCFDAENKGKIGYTPNSIAVEYDDGKRYIFNIQGEDDLNNNGLHCKVKGDLIPWTFTDVDGKEINISRNKQFLDFNDMVNILQSDNKHIVGIYPFDDSQENLRKSEQDTFSEGQATLEYFDANSNTIQSIEFKFDCELNIF